MNAIEKVPLLTSELSSSAPRQIFNYDYTALNNLAINSWSRAEDARLVSLSEDSETAANWGSIASLMGKTPQECFARYHSVAKRSINRDAWTKEEVRSLLELIEIHGPHNWAFIAEHLGSQRTAVDCLRYFQKHLNANHVNKKDWSPDEDLLLKDAVDKCGFGNWQEISQYVPQRTSNQCQFRWRKASECRDDTITGRWEEDDERKLFLACIALNAPLLSATKLPPEAIAKMLATGELTDVEAPEYGDCRTLKPIWVQVSHLVPGKTETQCRDKWTDILDPTINSSDFTSEEDFVISTLTSRLGEGNWTKIATYLPGRTDAAVRRRWHTLRKRSNLSGT